MFFEWKVDCSNGERIFHHNTTHIHQSTRIARLKKRERLAPINIYLLQTTHIYIAFITIYANTHIAYIINIVLICKSTDLFDFGTATTRTDDLCAHKRQILLYYYVQQLVTLLQQSGAVKCRYHKIIKLTNIRFIDYCVLSLFHNVQRTYMYTAEVGIPVRRRISRGAPRDDCTAGFTTTVKRALRIYNYGGHRYSVVWRQ